MLLERHVEALIVVANWLFVDIQLLGRFGEAQHSGGDDRLGIAGQRDQLGDGR